MAKEGESGESLLGADLTKLLIQAGHKLFGTRKDGYLEEENANFAEEVDRLNAGLYSALSRAGESSEGLEERTERVAGALMAYEAEQVAALFAESVGRVLAMTGKEAGSGEQAVFALGYLHLSKLDELLSSAVAQLRAGARNDRWDP